MKKKFIFFFHLVLWKGENPQWSTVSPLIFHNMGLLITPSYMPLILGIGIRNFRSEKPAFI